MYHRVADLEIDPWGLSVTEDNFEAQIRHVAEHWRPTRMADIATRQAPWFGRRPPIVITFDDGYADNLERALPILERYRVPATVFVTTDAIDSPTEFWWDRLEEIFLTTAELPSVLPSEVSALLNNRVAVASVAPDDLARVSPAWRAWEPYRHPRHELFHRTWQALFDSQPSDRARLVETLASWAGCKDESRPTHRTLTHEQLLELANHPLIDCQAHSLDHTPLPSLSDGDQQTILRQSRSRLEALLSRPVDGFAYPHGAVSALTIERTAQAGYAYGCTTETGPVRRSTLVHAIPRCGVGNWGASEFESTLRRWWDGQQ